MYAISTRLLLCRRTCRAKKRQQMRLRMDDWSYISSRSNKSRSSSHKRSSCHRQQFCLHRSCSSSALHEPASGLICKRVATAGLLG